MHSARRVRECPKCHRHVRGPAYFRHLRACDGHPAERHQRGALLTSPPPEPLDRLFEEVVARVVGRHLRRMEVKVRRGALAAVDARLAQLARMAG